MRRYQPSTFPGLAAAWSTGRVEPDDDAVLAEGDSEEHEYAALMTAADLSQERVADLSDGLRRRVVVVVEAPSAEAVVPLRDVVAVHADTADDADPDDDLAWYATQEVPQLLADFS
jgi:hypothetical protein